MEDLKKIKLNKILKALDEIREQIKYYQCELENDEDLTDKQFNCYADKIRDIADAIDLFEAHIDELRSANIDRINNILR